MMRIRVGVMLLAVLSPRVGAAQEAGNDLAAVRRAIDAQNHAWERATVAGDPAAIARIFADSGVEVGLSSGKAWKGRGAIQELFTRIYAQPHATEAVVQTDQVILDGTTAVEYGHYRFTYPPKDGQPQEDRGTYVVLWQRQRDGAWRILADMGVPPAPQ
jgi:uncharacterized protein (TIGR02246 family)